MERTLLRSLHNILLGVSIVEVQMDFNQSEIKTNNQSFKSANQWIWFKWVLLFVLFGFMGFAFYLISNDDYHWYAGLVGVAIGIIFRYLFRNWSGSIK
jgi:hypothetical protein